MSEPESDVDDEMIYKKMPILDKRIVLDLLLMSVSVGWKRKALTLLFISSHETMVYTLISKT
jgi:hypothetical protein